MGRRTAKDTAKLIEEVARGDRLLEEIRDPKLRETVRLALRLHKDPYSAPDAKIRSRIRSRVFNTLRPHGPTIADRVAVALNVLAKPTPYAMRALGLALAVLCIAASTALVSAGSVTDDPLYTVKIASEQMRLALATTPEDRAVVELSIAEHRLAEATALAALGNDDDATVASSEYGQHMAIAAAELAQIESIDSETATLVVQLQRRIDEHRATAAAAVARLSDSPQTASAARILAVLAQGPEPAADADLRLSPAAAIANRAATAANQIAGVAEKKVLPIQSAARTPEVFRTDPPERTDRSRPLASGKSRVERAAEAARRAAEEAKAAAQKAKQGGRRHAPTPEPRSDQDERDADSDRDRDRGD